MNHRIRLALPLPALLCLVALLCSSTIEARPNAGVKYSVTREENPRGKKNSLILPYAFSTDSLGLTGGIGAGIKGYGQEQLLIAGTALASTDGAYVGVLGIWDYQVTFLPRLFASAIGSLGYYPSQRAYTYPFYRPGTPRPGSNDSDENDYVETPGDDNWLELKLEYVLPLGSAKTTPLMQYRLKEGLLVSEPTGGSFWNPLEHGITVLLLKQYNRYQSYEPEGLGKVDGTIHPLQFGIYHDNTDFPTNPSYGCSQYLAYTHDFAWGDSEETWSFVEFEASKYFSLGASDWARQRVIALNLWTGYSPSWDEEQDAAGNIVVHNRPPFLDGARLGGFYRMRGFENNRFNDRAVLYTTAEYRYTPEWNPIGEISWLRWLSMDFWQFVGFIEGGRVANEYSFSELFSDWKADAGIGIRAMMAGGIVRLDIAASEEGAAAWVMFGHPF